MQRARQPHEEPPERTPGDRGGASPRFRELARTGRPRLDELVRNGGSVAPGELAGEWFRGWNTARLASLLWLGKFFKRFHPPDREIGFTGENVLAHQNALDEPWRPRLRSRGLLPFVLLPPGAGAAASLPHALVISYGAWPERGRFHPASRVTDFVVRPDPARPDLLLGAAHLAIRGREVLLEHFLLERVEPA